MIDNSVCMAFAIVVIGTIAMFIVKKVAEKDRAEK